MAQTGSRSLVFVFTYTNQGMIWYLRNISFQISCEVFYSVYDDIILAQKMSKKIRMLTMTKSGPHHHVT